MRKMMRLADEQECLRCGHKWLPRQQEIRICPKCKSPYWDKAKAKEPNKTESHSRGYIYIAGPMRGYPKSNFPAFYIAAKKLRKDGWTVLSPAEADKKEDGFDENTGENSKSMQHYLRRDTQMICEATTIYLLRGWEKSEGATLEYMMAHYIGLEILYEKGACRPR